ncbi:beta strand repeat-containing protein [Nocardioides kongjuensis]|uniref:Right handed beta helix domain-containing protein n=1 Tax=Nocardioides kongjuensis TaxID=349522 RepID=A0A852RV52_9ACTN|nr:putative Ig domain-containing protein [Nocardioides kongjuensis]NYD30452.1 hypothetical protein [Nocardioides kongjuensis]
MSAPAPRHRAPRAARPGRRRTSLLVTLALGTGLASVLTASPARAAGPWFVAPGGSNSGSCLSAASPCATLTGVLAKPGVAAGDTVNVAPGTYTDRPAVTKQVKVVGTGPNVVFQGGGTGSATWALAVNTSGNVELRNLTLTGGTYAAGGALPVVTASVKAYDVAITSSTAIAGAGVYVYSGSLEMYGGRIAGNKATATSGNATGWGGGAYVAAAGSLLLDGVTVENNKADGAGFASVTVGGGVASAGPLTVRNTTFRNNAVLTAAPTANTGYGGAIYSSNAATSVTGSTLTANTATFGGALANGAAATVTGTDVRTNTAMVGGGFYAGGALTVTRSTLAANTATVNYGGGVYAVGPLALDDTDVTGNSAPTGGGGVYSAATTTTIRNGSTVSANTAQSGAGVWSAGNLTVRDSAITDNDASFQAGGLAVGTTGTGDTPVASLTDSVVSGNSAAVAGGGIVAVARTTVNLTRTRLADNSAAGGGGIVVANDARADLDHVVASGNVATSLGGGAVFSSGRTTVVDSTLADNQALWTSGSTTGLGGAIYTGGGTTTAVAAELTVRRSTLSGNHAHGGSAVVSYAPASGATSTTLIDTSTIADNVSTSTSGALLNGAHRLTVTGSTLTGNSAAAGGSGAVTTFATTDVGIAGSVLAGNTPKACNLALTSGGHNLAGAGDSGCGVVPGATDLGPLGDHGGPTATRVPGPGSALLDAISPSTSTGLTSAVTGDPVILCAPGAVDQRGEPRRAGARCDIGAVEAAQVAPQVDLPATLDLTVGSTVDQVLVTSTAGSPRPVITSAPLPAGLSLVDHHDGTASLTGTPTGPGGSFPVTVTATNEAGTDQGSVTIEVHQAPVLTGPTSLTYRVGTAGGPDQFHQSGGHPAATLAIADPLPDGLTFTPGAGGTGTLAGTPAAGTGGVHHLTVTGSNGTGPDATWPFTLSIEEAAAVSANDATVRAGSAVDLPVTSSGYPAPVVTATGLPAGLTFAGDAITGTPAAGSGGSYDVTLTAANGVGDDAVDHLRIVVEEAPSVVGPAAVRFVADASGSFEFAGGGYPAPTLGIVGDLPPGISLDVDSDGTATLHGTAPESAVGSYPVTVTATNGIGDDAALEVVVEVAPKVGIATTSLPQAAVGSAYEAFVTADGGAAPYTFTVTGGSLPAGLTLGTDGRISGTPSGAPGTATVEIQVADGGAPVSRARRTFQLSVTKGVSTIVAEPVVTTNALLATGTLRARLTGGLPAQPLAGQMVVFKGAANLTVCSAVTDADGVASCNLTLVSTVLTALRLGYRADYAGSASWLPSSGTGALLQVSVHAVVPTP